MRRVAACFLTDVHSVRREALRFLLAGGAGTAACYFLYGGLVFLGVNLYLAMASGYAVGYVVNFHLGRRWVFREGRRMTSIGGEMLATLAVTLAGMGMNLLLLAWLVASPLLWNAYAAGAFAIGAVTVWNYAARKIWVYR